MRTAGEGSEQGRLAGAVAADQRDALAGIELKRGRVEQGNVAVSETAVVEFEEGHD
jgi:hypothetical protein